MAIASCAPGAVQSDDVVETANPQGLVEASAEELIVGRAVLRPIYDRHGTLLLSEGMTITPEFKRLLQERDLGRIKLHSEDVLRVTLRGVQPVGNDEHCLDDGLAARLDQVIDSGLLFVVNSDSAVLDRMRALGCKDYDEAKQRELTQRNQETGILVDNLVKQALRGKQVDSSEVMRLTAQYLGDMIEDVDGVLASVLEAVKQRPIASNCVNVALLAMSIGIEMGLDATNVRNLGLAALVHDWGMARVPEEILNADRPLAEGELHEIRKHPIASLRLLERLPGIPSVIPLIAYQVHERPNGNGYPRGRTGERIHPLAKIIGVADAYHALVSPRPFRPPLTPYAAMECLLRQASTRDVEPRVVQALLMVQSLFPIGSYVSLSDGSVARVLRRNGDKFMRPIVRLVQDRDGAEVPLDHQAAIVDLEQAGLEIATALPTPGRGEIALNPEIIQRTRRRNESSGRDAIPELSISELFASRRPVVRAADSETTASLERYTESQKRRAELALAYLDRISAFEDKLYEKSRKEARKRFRGVVRVCVPNTGGEILDLRGPGAFRAVARDVSRSGLSFVHPAPLTACHLIVGVEIAAKEVRWFLAEVVRKREIAEADFWEYAITFVRPLVV